MDDTERRLRLIEQIMDQDAPPKYRYLVGKARHALACVRLKNVVNRLRNRGRKTRQRRKEIKRRLAAGTWG